MVEYSPEKRIMYKVSDLYYRASMNQEQIAEKLNISRPTVSRILKRAKKCGVVQVQVINPFQSDYNTLEKEMEKEFGLLEVIVVDTVSDYATQLHVLGEAGADYLERILKKDEIVGVTMGISVSSVAVQARKRGPHPEVTVIPLLGGAGQLNQKIHSNQIVLDFRRAYDCKSYLLYAPAFVSDARLREELKKDSYTKEIFDFMTRIDVAVFGIGAMGKNSTVKMSGYYTDDIIESMKKNGFVGDIGLHVIDHQGNGQNVFNQCVFGCTLEEMRKAPIRVGVAAGINKADAILGALHGNYPNVLITDYETANLILKKQQDSQGEVNG
uniref:sugar-binding transcriptional regulator n=1 Tax=Ndongobacter massiliensis TaxID=1871025 RepID=UPI000B26C54E|nr:sugar-binding transcriptional regulator [Ndongobacter massiliensis]